MPLPYVIEYLLSLRRPGGDQPLVHEGGSELIIPIFPPNTTITLIARPYGGDYAIIIFHMAFGRTMIPGAFHSWAQQWGSRVYDTTIASLLINTENLDGFIFVTQGEPSTTQITNNSPLNQYYEGYNFFLTIASEGDYQLILAALKRLATSTKLEQLATQAVALLTAISTGAPAPQAAIGGG